MRRALWREALQLEQEHCGKDLVTPEERYCIQRDLRIPILGEQPQQEWVTRLECLVCIEMMLVEGYRVLHW